MDAIAQLCKVVPSAWGGDYFGWWQRLQQLLQDREEVRAAARDWLAGLECAVLGEVLQARSQTLAEAVASNALGVDLGWLLTGMKEYSPGDLLQNLDERFWARSDLAASAESRTDLLQLLGDGQQRIGLRLSGDSGSDSAGIVSLLTAAQDLGQEPQEWILLGEGRYTAVAELASMWQQLKDNSAVSRPLRRVKALVDPFAGEWALSDEVLIGFVEWPQRPGVVAGATTPQWEQVWRALEIGYRGVCASTEMGPMDTLLRACMIGWKRVREPVGRWTMTMENPLHVSGSGAGVQAAVYGLVNSALG